MFDKRRNSAAESYSDHKHRLLEQTRTIPDNRSARVDNNNHSVDDQISNRFSTSSPLPLVQMHAKMYSNNAHEPEVSDFNEPELFLRCNDKRNKLLQPVLL